MYQGVSNDSVFFTLVFFTLMVKFSCEKIRKCLNLEKLENIWGKSILWKKIVYIKLDIFYRIGGRKLFRK